MKYFVDEQNSSDLLTFLIRVYNSSKAVHNFLTDKQELRADVSAGGDKFSDVE